MTDDHDHPPELDAGVPESLLPYDHWVEDAYREVMLKAIEHVAAEGLPGEHHFYLTFRTSDQGVEIPARLRAQYPHEMTIVLQHRFWDLAVDRKAATVSVGLSFGGVQSTLVIPVRAITAFADPHVHVAMRFTGEPVDVIASEPEDAPEDASPAQDAPAEEAQIVSLDAFRRKPPARD